MCDFLYQCVFFLAAIISFVVGVLCAFSGNDGVRRGCAWCPGYVLRRGFVWGSVISVCYLVTVRLQL